MEHTDAEGPLQTTAEGDGEDWDVTAARVAGSMAWHQAGSTGRGFILKPAWARTKLRPFVFHTGPLAALGAG